MGKKQVYFTFLVAIISFITFKHVQKYGADQYLVMQILYQQMNGFYNFSETENTETLPFQLSAVSETNYQESNGMYCFDPEHGTFSIFQATDSLNTPSLFSLNGSFSHVTNKDSVFYLFDNTNQTIYTSTLSNNQFSQKEKLVILPVSDLLFCPDRKENRLLMLTTEESGSGDVFAIHNFDLQNNEYQPNDLFQVKISELELFAVQHSKLNKELNKTTINQRLFSDQAKPVSLAIHPKTDEVYILFPQDKLLAVYGKNGQVHEIQSLKQTTITQPASITFNENGDLLILDKGSQGVAVIQKFTWTTLKNN